MELFLWMVGAHFVGDFSLQSRWVAENKGTNWYIMMAHCIIWTACVCIPIQLLMGGVPGKVLLFLLPIHWLVDKGKCVLLNTTLAPGPVLLYLDQGLHLIQLFIVWTILV